MKRKNFILILIALAFFVSFVSSRQFWDKTPAGDGLHYNNLSTSIVQEGRFAEDGELSARRDPGYVFFLAGVYKIFGFNVEIVYIIQIMMFAMIAVTSYYLGLLLFEQEKLARLASILTAFFYPLAMHAGIIFTEILFTFLFLLAIYCFVRAFKKDQLSFYLVSAVFFGAAALTRSIILYLPFFLAIVFVLSNLKNWKRAVIAMFVFLLAFSVVVTPWMYRNYKNFETFSISQQSGDALFFAVQRLRIPVSELPAVFTANILGDFFAAKIFGGYDKTKIEEGNFGQKHTELSELGFSEKEIDATLAEIALSEIKAKPLRYLLVVPPIEFLKIHTPIFPVNSIQGLFSDSERYKNIPDIVKGAIILGVRGIYLIFFAAVIYGIINSRKYRKELVFIFAILLYVVGVYSVVHGIPRYSLPIYPLYIMLFSFGILHLMERRKRKQTLSHPSGPLSPASGRE